MRLFGLAVGGVEEEPAEHVATGEHFVVVDHVAVAESVAAVELGRRTAACFPCSCSLEIVESVGSTERFGWRR